jgi:hypothetical protein
MRSRDLDAKLAERALRERWPVPEERRPELVAKLIEVALASETPPRERVSAIKALLAASKVNLDALRLSLAAAEFEELSARLAALERPGESDGAAEPAGGD